MDSHYDGVVADGDSRFVNCPICGYFIYFESVGGHKSRSVPAPPPAEVLKVGDVVKIDNLSHPWHEEIALICAMKDKFYRLELNGKKLWVPFSWVKKHEPS